MKNIWILYNNLGYLEFNVKVPFTSNGKKFNSLSLGIDGLKYDNVIVFKNHSWIDNNYKTVKFDDYNSIEDLIFIEWLAFNGEPQEEVK